ncbi:MAG: class I SAM-dependent methyltransferase [Candidatus Obscuribacterales bacterium]|nr:class I SAM-dependent methyltransferase [Candidatus Obscuribacterales bacterium]
MTAYAKLQTLNWQADRLLVDDLLFKLVLSADDQDAIWKESPHFQLYKPRELVEQYGETLQTYGLAPQNILELGLYDGGSLVLWHWLFQPEKIVGVDIVSSGDSKYFRQYKDEHQLKDKLKTYWGVDQKDGEALRQIVAENFKTDLDLIIDDASHYYEETKASFETLYPLLKPGGLYIIEDWQWSHWQEFQSHDYFKDKASLTKLLGELIAWTGSKDACAPKTITVYSRMLVVERGAQEPPSNFRLAFK